jgi:hypothetical protein
MQELRDLRSVHINGVSETKLKASRGAGSLTCTYAFISSKYDEPWGKPSPEYPHRPGRSTQGSYGQNTSGVLSILVKIIAMYGLVHDSRAHYAEHSRVINSYPTSTQYSSKTQVASCWVWQELCKREPTIIRHIATLRASAPGAM